MAKRGVEAAVQGTWGNENNYPMVKGGNGNRYPMAKVGMEAAVQGTWGNGNSYPMVKGGGGRRSYLMVKGGLETALLWLKWEWKQLSHG